MKLYNKNTFTKLGFDEIRAFVVNKALSDMGKDACSSIGPIDNTNKLLRSLNKVREFKQLLDSDDHFPLRSWSNVYQLFRKLEIEGNWLSTFELFSFLSWLRMVQDVREFLEKQEETYPALASMVKGQAFQKELITRLDRTLDERGNIRDQASPELATIRRRMTSISKELRNVLYKVLRRANEHNWSIEKEITIRNDRLVIPVKADAKGRIPGFVQDVSQSGNTVFVEPAESLPLNNQLRELNIEEQNEIIRILQAITGEIYQHKDALKAYHDIMVEFDVIRAKALLARELQANLPIIEPKGDTLIIQEGFYPLLQLKAREEPFDVIPVNISLDGESRILVISGPNAGGKSVSLKTVGLLQLMLQSGFLIPVNEHSTFRLFDSLFIHIGDEQSVANDLSTYTSHLYQMRQMGDHMNRNSLFLIDEFGSGTDPSLGGAIAEAFLERFVNQRAIGIITTHYGNIKEFASTTKGVINGAMQFDTKELKPTYKLLPGIPGRSYAFEIAKRVGVHHTVLARAKRKIGTEEIQSEKLLKELEQKNTELNRLLADNKRKENRLKDLVSKHERLKAELEKNRKQFLHDAQLEAKKIIQNANAQVERTIKEIKEHNAEKAYTRKVRQELEEAIPEIVDVPVLQEEIQQKKKKDQEKPYEILADKDIQEGDWVKLKNSNAIGVLQEVQGNKGVVESGELRISVKLKQLVKISKPEKERKSNGRGYIPDLPTLSTRLTLDVKGMRVEEAIKEVDKFIDEGRFNGLQRLSILHGKGSGVLRDAIRKHLRDLSFISNITDAPVDGGGAGWTIFSMRN